ncbi:MAG TPA: hypothetical protein VHV83_13485 [Armatimonadota bacterium]|nr:hypothetical protein [Armatimonadota bacterium]
MRSLQIKHARIVELGCFDAKTLDFLASADIEVQEYFGYDANWEGGLDIGRENWHECPTVHLNECTQPEEMLLLSSKANVGICMETFEHLPDELVKPYIKQLHHIVDGYLFVTVPVERGTMFLLRHLMKRVLRMEDYSFTRREFWSVVFSKMSDVQHDGHKGFDDRQLIRQLADDFDILTINGILPGLPVRTWNFNIGIVAKSR